MEYKTLTPLKARIRSVKRLLVKEGVAVSVVEEKKKELVALEKRKIELEENNAGKVLSKKYKQVRFIERKKLVRSIKHLQSEEQLTPEQEKELASAQSDLHYIDNFPSHLKYISVFKSKGTNATKNRERIEEIKQLIHDRKASARQAPVRVAVDTELLDFKDSVVEKDDFFVQED